MPFFPFTYNTHPHSILTLAPQVLTAALEGSLYPLSDVVTSDIQLGEDPLDRSCKPTPKKVSDGFKLNMKLIEYLLVSNFQLVILCVGMTASVELTDILNKKQGCLATSTYHPVLVASDTRNEVTSAAARLTLAAGARLTRLALDATLNSESEAPGLLDIFSTLMDSKDKAKETLTSSCTLRFGIPTTTLCVGHICRARSEEQLNGVGVAAPPECYGTASRTAWVRAPRGTAAARAPWHQSPNRPIGANRGRFTVICTLP